MVIDDRIKSTVGYRIRQAEEQGYPYIVVVGRKVGIYNIYIMALMKEYLYFLFK